MGHGLNPIDSLGSSDVLMELVLTRVSIAASLLFNFEVREAHHPLDTYPLEFILYGKIVA